MYHSTLGLRVIKKKKITRWCRPTSACQSLGRACQKSTRCARQLFSKVNTAPTSGLKTIHHFLGRRERWQTILKLTWRSHGTNSSTLDLGKADARAAEGGPAVVEERLLPDSIGVCAQREYVEIFLFWVMVQPRLISHKLTNLHHNPSVST